MKKLIEKDKKTRKYIEKFEKNKKILKSLYKNCNLLGIIRWKANSSINNLEKKTSINKITNRCILTINKKKFNKFTNFSRMVFLKLIKNQKLSNLYKSSW